MAESLRVVCRRHDKKVPSCKKVSKTKKKGKLIAENSSGEMRKAIKTTLAAGDLEVIRAELIKRLDSISARNQLYFYDRRKGWRRLK